MSPRFRIFILLLPPFVAAGDVDLAAEEEEEICSGFAPVHPPTTQALTGTGCIARGFSILYDGDASDLRGSTGFRSAGVLYATHSLYDQTARYLLAGR